jgi:uncharacterized iron-regulated membrane protein
MGGLVTVWQRWVQQPQGVFLRRAIFQIHLWTGLAIGLYVVMISLSGSVLVYRSELYQRFSPRPRIVAGSGTPLSAEALTPAARRGRPGAEIASIRRGDSPNHAVEITFERGGETERRLFDPYTGEDLGNPVPAGFRFTTWLLELHDTLLLGEAGKRVNGIGALLLVLLSATGAVIWWPGIRSWRRSLTLDVRAGWKRLTWSLHSMLGAWFLVFVLMWGITGTYLAYANEVAAFIDYLEPLDETNPVERLGDRIQYWLAYLHFGRLGGRGIPGCGRGLCNSITKATWAAVGLVPPVMFVTALLMWWNRVGRRLVRPPETPSPVTEGTGLS